MGLFNVLEKIFNGTEDFMIAVGNQHAKQIDQMTDEEIEKRFSKPAEEIRMKAETMQMQSEMMQMSKEKRMMEAEMRRMKQEQYEMNHNKK